MVCFTLSDQSIDGAAAVARTSRSATTTGASASCPSRCASTRREGEGGRRPRAGPGELRALPARHGRVRGERLLGRGGGSLPALLRVRGDPGHLRRRAPSQLPAQRLRAAHRRPHRRPGPLAGGDERGDAAHLHGRLHPAPARRRPTSSSAMSPRTRCGRTGSPPCSPRRGIRVLRPSSAGERGRQRPGEAERGAASATGRSRSCPPPTSVAEAQGVWDAISAADPAGTGRRLIPVRVGDVTARAAVLRADGRRPDPPRRDRGGRRAAPGARLPAEAADQPRPGPRAAVPGTSPRSGTCRPGTPASPAAPRSSSSCTTSCSAAAPRSSLPLALHGLGGVGKTQVAQEYAHRFMADYDLVWWIPAEQPDLIDPSLAELAPQLGLRAGDAIAGGRGGGPGGAAPRPPYDRWLLIFDNADEPDEVEDIFPGGPGHVIVTSRNPAWSQVAEPMEMDVFSRPESLDLPAPPGRRPVRGETPTGWPRRSATCRWPSSRRAPGWPRPGCPPPSTWTSSRTARRGAGPRPAEDYPTSVAATCRLSFDRLRDQSPAAARLLELCSFFSPEPISMRCSTATRCSSPCSPTTTAARARTCSAG